MHIKRIHRYTALLLMLMLAWTAVAANAEGGLENLERIESEAFADCASLRVFKCLSMDMVIDEDAFAGDDDLLIICYSNSAIDRYAQAHGIPCQYLDAFDFECDTQMHGCVGLPVTWSLTNVMAEAKKESTFTYQVLCGTEVKEEGTLPAALKLTYTPKTAGEYTLKVTVKSSASEMTLSSPVLEVKSKYILGTYEQDGNSATSDPIEWRVLTVSGDKALVVSDKILRAGSYFNPYWIKYKYVYWASSYIGTASNTNYRGSAEEAPERLITGISPTSIPLEDGTRGKESDLYPLHARYWCNNVFYPSAFTKEEKARIVYTHNTNEDNTGTDSSGVKYTVDGGPDTNDYVFFLSYNEVMKYMPAKSDRVATPTPVAAKQIGSASQLWWLRSPGRYRVNAMYITASTGGISKYGSDVGHSSLGYRPAMWVIIGG